jgi:excisionase family DNA binding protein
MVMHTDGGRQPDLLTVGQVAEMLSVHPNTLRRWTQQGLLKSYRIGPRKDRRFQRAEVLEFLGGDDPSPPRS